MVQLMQSSSSGGGGGGGDHSILCDNADNLAVQKGGEKAASTCGGGDVFGWSDSIARTVHG